MSITIGLVGAGGRAERGYAPVLASSSRFRFGGVWGRTEEATRAIAEKHAVPAFERFDDLIARCDALIFAVPPAVQPDLADHAAAHGKGVLLEQPTSVDLAGAERLAETVQKVGVVSQTALTWRYADKVRHFLREEVQRVRPLGGNGRLIASTPAGRSGERATLLILGPHLIDLLEAALGRIADVRAHGDSKGWLGLLLEHAGGRFSEASMYAAAHPAANQAIAEVFGPGGAAQVDCATAAGPEAIKEMVTDFAEAVEKGVHPELDVEHALHLQRIIDNAETDLIAKE